MLKGATFLLAEHWGYLEQFFRNNQGVKRGGSQGSIQLSQIEEVHIRKTS